MSADPPPVRPGASQSRKLGLRAGTRLAVLGAPPGWALESPPPLEPPAPDGTADVVLWFVRAAAELDDAVRHGRSVFPDGALWVLWPRRAAGHRSDVTDEAVRAAVLPHGLVDVKVAAVDHDWSGLKIVWRTERRT